MPNDSGGDPARLRRAVATACRVLADRGLVEHILGHVSVRAGCGDLLVRCRGPLECGLADTTPADIHAVPVADGAPRPDLGGWAPPNELPIHTGVLRARPDVTAVVHAHPPAVVTASLLDTPLVPIYGAYDIPGARLAAGGVPVWPRAALITTAALAGDMVAALGDRPVVILRGHGLVSVAGGPPEAAIARAVVQAVSVDTLARMTLAVRQAGGTPRPIDADDLAALPDLGSGFAVDTMWRYLVRRVTAAPPTGPGTAAPPTGPGTAAPPTGPSTAAPPAGPGDGGPGAPAAVPA